ncbi:flagellar type III secretion system pore protein FliP [Candidatus Galacturonibacter soehngenii]|uniref:Flagellar biosynthetic protein FliP n=1 Tax=Candidatus Galacturonatibacter soehngenii TaxID=2307010 RepID=A0A7V7QJA6_9FIRM|nr:flagellar type III secretion system pore protein FliP [Candidatus Galacturonibacter soehngenii]KAB1437694.1 flagellar type III secretion system pore protein FliP [Candidatus Galacturonibacter soehngenii]MBA4686925.1 flagellar type III secretion system pore protein FliP [Candidatus Galacturonibacter soehngenii]
MTIKKVTTNKISILLGLFFGIILMVSFASNTAYATSQTTTTQDGNTTTTNSSNVDTLSPSNTVGGLNINYNNNGEGGLSANIKILLFLTIISLAPSILIMLTSFTRIIIVLHFTRNALNTQTAPPNQVLVGLSLFLTLFIMGPIFTQINDTAIKPLDAGQITQEQALETGLKPLREFMFKQTQTKDIQLFLDIAQINNIEKQEEIPISVLIPSFIISELRSAFIMGFLIYIPFIIIDMVVASTLMSMGMMMLPPTTISMPFKILLFILADGWNLIIGNLVKTFY